MKQLSQRELGTVLAALRYWQAYRGVMSESMHDIETDGGTLTPLSNTEIDSLCESINAEQPIPTAVIEVNGGAIYCTRSNVPMRVVVLDADLESSDEEGHRQVGDKTYYVLDAVMTEQAEPGQDGIDQDFVQRVVAQL